MDRFVKHSMGMTPEQSVAISKKTFGLYIYNFLIWHTAPKARVCFLDEELKKELMSRTGISQDELDKTLRYLRSHDIIKAARCIDEIIGYVVNPCINDPEDPDQVFYDKVVDGCYRCNYKLFLELTNKTKGKRGNKGEKQGKEESNKSYHEEEELKGDSREIVYEEVTSGIAVDDEPKHKEIEVLGSTVGGGTVYKVGNKAKEKIVSQFDSIFNG